MSSMLEKILDNACNNIIIIQLFTISKKSYGFKFDKIITITTIINYIISYCFYLRIRKYFKGVKLYNSKYFIYYQ